MDNIRYIYEFVGLHAKQSPSSVAVADRNTQIDYGTLEKDSNDFCEALKQHKINKGDLIAVNIKHKTPALIICLLGILKRGAAYVPVSTSLPKILFQDMLNSIKPKAIISDKSYHDSAPIQSLFIQSSKVATDIHREVIGHDLAYVMYTSGTTGKPKGVPISHQNLIDTFKSWQSVYALKDHDRHLQMADYCFDVFTGDWIRALCSGASLYLYAKEQLLHPENLYGFINTHNITMAEFVPAVIKKLTQYCHNNQKNLKTFRVLVCGSDTWTINDCQQTIAICPSSTKVFNSYGLTETTIDSTYFDCKQLIKHKHLRGTDIVPIGKALPHAEVLLLNDAHKPVKYGEMGELFIGGKGTSPIGYLENKSLSEQRFLTLEHNGKKIRAYRTGDQALKLPNGDIQFCGRNDLQTNIHGKRVDCLTTEAIINRYPGIEQCIVVSHNKNGRNTLHAFLIADDSVYKSTLVSFLKERLPAHYIPHHYHVIDNIALTRNGKVSRDYNKFHACPLPYDFQPARNAQERVLVSIWQKYLFQSTDIGITTPFSCLQKKPLHFARMIAEINLRYNVNIKPRITTSTIKALCHEIQSQQDQVVTRAPLSSIAIIGGGPASIALCHSLVNELIERNEKHVEITIYEKNETIGPGVPYQHQNEDAYILNLPSTMMALGNNVNQDFHSWYQQHYGENYSSDFPPRHVFGQYITDIAHELTTIANGHHIQLKFVTNTEINKVKKIPNQQEYCLIAEHTYFTANFVVFCTGHMSSGNYRELIGVSGYRHNSWAKHVRRRIEKSQAVGILGTRISAIDLVMKLKDSRHVGKIHLFSRSGLLPTVLAKKIEPYHLKYFNIEKIEQLLDHNKEIPLDQLINLLMREVSDAHEKTIQIDTIISNHKQINAQSWLEKEIQNAETDNKPWQQILLSAYPLIPQIWSYLSLQDKQKFIRKYHSLFLTYLAGFPLENAKKLLKLVQSGAVEIHGGLKTVTHKNDHFILSTDSTRLTTKHLFNATGPGYKTNIYPLFHDLERTGLCVPHPCGGLKVDTQTQELINNRDKKTEGMFAIGELTRGEFWATTDMGQVNAQCLKTAPVIVNQLQKRHAIRASSNNRSPKTTRRTHEV